MSKTKTETVKYEGKEWKDALDRAFKKESKKVTIDGFRKGKAPKEVFLKKYGEESLWYSAADYLANDAYSTVLKKNEKILMDVITRPELSVKEINNDGVTFDITFTLKPDVKLGKYKDLDVKKAKAEVSEEEIKEAIENLKSRYKEDVLKDGKIEKGDLAIIDFDGSVDGKHFDGGKAENYKLEVGSNTFIPGFEDQLIGHKSGDKVEVNVTFPKDYQAKDLAGKDAKFDVTIHEVKEVKVPELDDDFFADLGMENVKDEKSLRDTISEDILNNKEQQNENEYVSKLLEEIEKNTEVDIPDVMIKDEEDRMIDEYDQNLKNQGLSLDLYYKFTNSDEQAIRDQMRDQAIKRVKDRLVLEEIVKEEKITSSKEEIDKYAEDEAKNYGVKKKEFINAVGGNTVLEYELNMRKAIDLIKGDKKEEK